MKSSHENTVQDRIKENGKIYGNKAANLMELDSFCNELSNKQIHVEIPQIFPIADSIIKEHLDKNNKEWRILWDEFVQEQGKRKALTERAKLRLKQLRELIITTFKNWPIHQNIINAINLPVDTLLMVRSTGEEDTVDMANPGGNKSVSAVNLDTTAISNAVGVVVASYLSEKSLTQRLLSGDDISKPSFMPVLIQKMIGEKVNGNDMNDVIVSGVMYAHSDYACIDAAPGHGELIVNSKAPFDTFDVTQEGLVHAKIYQKDNRLVPVNVDDEGETKDLNKKRKLVFKQNQKKLQTTPSFSPQIAKKIAAVGEAVATHYGMPMDIEFVYRPHEETLYLVQARPIPQDIQHTIKPSAVAPDRWAEIKNDAEIEKIKCQVVKDAGNAVQVITSPDQVIKAKQISTALKLYLNSQGSQHNVRAILIENDAPSTSHEAAFFNALGIPVLQTKLESVTSWLNQDMPVMIIDPQHQQLINWTNKIKDHLNAEKELTKEKIIKEGLFVSSLNAVETLLPYDYEMSDSIKETINSYISSSEKVDPNRIFSQLLKCIDMIEGVKINNKNDAAFSALRKVASIFKMLGTSSRSKESNTPHLKLFQHAMCAIAEIDHGLKKYSNLSENGENNELDFHQLLDSIARLKALIINPGKNGLYSDSIVQIAIQNHVIKSVDINILGEQREYLQEFLKLNTLALRQSTKESWTGFALECSKKPYTRKLLSRIIYTACQYHLESELINSMFVDIKDNVDKNSPSMHERVLADLFEMMSDNEFEINKYHIKENERLIESWEGKIEDWSNPEKFTRLFKDYQRDILSLIQSINIDKTMQKLTKKIILGQVQRLTEMMDKTIKSLKGSPEYKDKIDTVEGSFSVGMIGNKISNLYKHNDLIVVGRFAQMLGPYFQLMEKWMRNIPDLNYQLWIARIGEENRYNDKEAMISQIKETFNAKLSDKTAKQLEPSGSLDVSSVTLGTTTSFKRQFVDNKNKYTLEDLFSLMHQNIMSCVSILGSDSQFKSDRLPDQLAQLIEKIDMKDPTREIFLLGITHKHPDINLEYNIPCGNHSIKLNINYNTQSHLFAIQWRFFGINLRNRMDLITRIVPLEGLLLNGKLPYEPSYNQSCRSFDCTWEINGDQIEPLAKNLTNIIRCYYDLTLSDPRGLSNLLKRHFESTDNFKQLSELPADLIKRIVEEITRDKGITLIALHNPYLLDKLHPELFSRVNAKDIYNSLCCLDGRYLVDFESLDFIINKCNLKLDVNYKPSMLSYYKSNNYMPNNRESLLFLIRHNVGNEGFIKYLKKYKPDLSRQFDAIPNELRYRYQDVNVNIIRELHACHAPVSFLSIINNFDKPDIMSALGISLDQWDGNKITNCLYEYFSHDFYSYNLTKKYSNGIEFIKVFAEKINFDYKPNGKQSLLELCLNNFIPFGLKDYAMEMTALLSKKPVDLSIHTKILNDAFSNKSCFDLTNAIIKNAINVDSINGAILDKIIDSQQEIDSFCNFLAKLSPIKLVEVIYKNVEYLPVQTYQQLINKYGSNIDLAYNPAKSGFGFTLFEKIAVKSNAEDVLRYIEKYKPDLSQHKNLLSIILAKDYSSVQLLTAQKIADETNVVDNDLLKLIGERIGVSVASLYASWFSKKQYNPGLFQATKLPDGASAVESLTPLIRNKSG